jgi:hypothetical protein
MHYVCKTICLEIICLGYVIIIFGGVGEEMSVNGRMLMSYK